MCCELGFMQLSHTFGGNEQGTGEQGERPGGSGAGQIQRARHANATADGDVATDGRTTIAVHQRTSAACSFIGKWRHVNVAAPPPPPPPRRRY